MNLKISDTIGNGVKNFIAWLKSDSISKMAAEGKPLKEMIAEKVNAMKEMIAEKVNAMKEKTAEKVNAMKEMIAEKVNAMKEKKAKAETTSSLDGYN